ncbi:DUF4435 domain-containing protein [Gluconobacter kondonii]|uniref:DUF4435 domain-containing protein n=1 Tax=Gluconobacter kondonii TaxID=941463 RepID=UPI0020A033FC|nr:DUF4435 domain-containing protein [Gluconobacter kondonii]MCP1237696.1 DUF4435 domain-containing protein [Gluconobacter kondonii]
MKNFTEYFTDANYISAYNFDGKGIIYIEDENDKRFWTEVIENLARNKYAIKIATTKPSATNKSEIKVRGKGALTKLYDTLNKTVMVAVDSDFDYICPESSKNAEKLSKNKFIIHTFSYSTESVIFCEKSIKSISEKIKYFIEIDFNINDSLKTISNIIFESFSMFVYLKNKKISLENTKKYNDIFSFSKKGEILDNDYKLSESIIMELIVKSEEKKNKYLKYIEENSLLHEYNIYLDKVKSLGLNKDNVYRFIRGHELEEKIVMPILECLKFKILHAEISAIELEEHVNTTTKEETKRKINNFFSNKLDLETIICNDRSFKEDYIFNKIKEKFCNALET